MSSGSLHRLYPQSPAEAEALIERARQGDTRAWAALYEACFPALIRHVTYMVFDTQAAEDIVQESFVAAFSSIERYAPTASFQSWVRGIAQNHVRRHWRSHVRRERAHQRLEVVRDGLTAPAPDARLRRSQEADALSDGVAALPEKLREAFVLADLQELSAAEGADILGISAENFRVRLFRARERLRAHLQQTGHHD